MAFTWTGPGPARRLVAVNYAAHQSQCYVTLPWRDLDGRTWRLQDLTGPAVYDREGADLSQTGPLPRHARVGVPRLRSLTRRVKRIPFQTRTLPSHERTQIHLRRGTAPEGTRPTSRWCSAGPLYQLWRGTRLAGDTLQLLHRRVLAAVLLTWVPLVLLSIAEGHAWGTTVTLPLLYDVGAARALSARAAAVDPGRAHRHQRMRPVVGQFLDRGLIPDAARAQFDAAITAAMRLRNSVAAEVLLIAFVYVVGVGVIWRTQVALDVASWYGGPADGRLQPSLAGWWLGFVSLPVFQFLLLRWYFRVVIWARFLWHVSRIDLRLIPTHDLGPRRRVLGVGILARDGADLLPGPQVAMNAPGGTLAPLLATVHTHPTISEAVKVAAAAADRGQRERPRASTGQVVDSTRGSGCRRSPPRRP